MLRELGAEAVEVRLPEQLDDLDGLVIPGGESTAITRLMRLYGLEEAMRSFSQPVFGTCAGMILLDRAHLGLVDIDVERNGYGRQVASFEADLALAGDGRAASRRLHPRAAGDGGRPGGRGAREPRRQSGAAPPGPLPRRVVPSGADRRYTRPRTVSGTRTRGVWCQGIASGRRSSTRRARPTRSAASSSRSSRRRSSSPPRRAGPIRPRTSRSRTRSRRRSPTRCRRTRSSARSRAARARTPTRRCTRRSSTRATARTAWPSSSRR